MTHRRQILVAAGSLLTAGCSSGGTPDDSSGGTRTSTNTPQWTQTTPRETRENEAAEPMNCSGGYNLTVATFAPTEQLPLPTEGASTELVSDTVTGGTTEIQTYGDAPIKDGEYFETADAFYRFSYTVGDSVTVTAFELDIIWEADQRVPDDETALVFEDLSERDKRAFTFALNGPRYKQFEQSNEVLRLRDVPAPYPDGRDGSVFPEDETTWVEYEDRVYEVSVGDLTTLERRTFVYEADQVASDDASFEQHIVDQHLIALAELPEAGRTVMREAIEGGYEECTPLSDGLEAVDEALTDSTALPEPHENSWYVSFEGERYRLERQVWVV